MSINQLLPFASTVVMVVFTIWVLQRYLTRRAPHFLFWGIGLAMFASGSFAEAYLAFAWNRWVFFCWYLFGAALNAGWIGHGTLLLLVRKPWVKIVTVLLVAGSLYAVYLMLQVMPQVDTAYANGVFTTARPISEQYATSRVTGAQGLLPVGAAVRLTTPFFNVYGLLTLVGGALYSAYLFLKKRILPNRVIGNVLIAAGALSIGAGGALDRIGMGQFLFATELIAAILMFLGFRWAAQPQPSE